jgi:hypothetical protein
VADLRTRFIEDYAGGLLNISRQELSSTGEVLAQDGFVEGTSLFVEDGRGVKSGLRLGSSIVECVDPTTEIGVLNVRSADRTYAKVKDLKTFITAVASAQGALSQSVADSVTNLEEAFQSLESDVQGYSSLSNQNAEESSRLIDSLSVSVQSLVAKDAEIDSQISDLSSTVVSFGRALEQARVVTEEETVIGNTELILANSSVYMTLNGSGKYFGITEITTNVPAWVSLYVDSAARGSDIRNINDPITQNSGIILDAVTTTGNLTKKFMPITLGSSDESKFYLRVVNKAGSPAELRVTLKWIKI